MSGITKCFRRTSHYALVAVDALDIKILRDLIQSRATSPLDPDFRKSFSTIARNLGVDADTIRSRVRRLHQDGLVKDWHIIINPHLFGGDDYAVWFDVQSAAKEGLIEELKLLEGVFEITSFLGSGFIIFFHSENPHYLDRQLELMRRVSKVQFLDFAKIAFPECNLRLSKTDWAVLRALHRSPRKTHAAISKEAGLSTRTVKRRLERMVLGGVAFAFPVIDPKALQGAVMAALLVSYPSDRKAEVDIQIASFLSGLLFHILHLEPRHSGDQFSVFSLMLTNVSEAKEVLEQVKQVSYIRSARIDLHEDMIIIFDSLDESLASRLEKMLGADG